ncbi:hypothetical protein [Circoviridae sp.]|nr:hypothetical protein [Circoviridae sp.]UOF78163.1 hypothetical protein [Circoviridae sp.]
MNWQHPPSCWEELQLWKVFVKTTDQDVWNIIRQWVNIHKNPFVVPDVECEEAYEIRKHYQEALLYIIHKA